MEEGRKFNTDCPTNKPSSFIHYPLSNKKSGRFSSGFFCAHAEKVFVFVFVFVFYYYLCSQKQSNHYSHDNHRTQNIYHGRSRQDEC